MNKIPALPDDVKMAYDALPQQIRDRLLQVRALIFRLADETESGPLTETLKWGEPAYLTEASKSGSAIRLGRMGDAAAVFFNCNTTLVHGFREQFDGVELFEGNRALVLTDATPEDALAICLARALTYHRDKWKVPA